MGISGCADSDTMRTFMATASSTTWAVVPLLMVSVTLHGLCCRHTPALRCVSADILTRYICWLSNHEDDAAAEENEHDIA